MSMIATRLLAFRAANTNIDKWEHRATIGGAYEMFKMQTESPTGIISKDLKQKAIDAIGSDLEIPVLDFEAKTIQNVTQPVVIVGDPSTSALYTVTFTDYYFGFRIFPAMHKNNEISMQREFNRQMKAYTEQLLEDWDTQAIATLEAAKTQVLGDTLGGRYTLTANVITAPIAERDRAIGDINPLMRSNKFRGRFHVVGNPSMESHVRNNLLEQGEFNSRDKTYQYNDKTWWTSLALADGAGVLYTGFAVAEDSVGIVEQFGADAILGHKTHKHTWSVERVPVVDARMGTFYYEDAIDGSSDPGGTHMALNTATKVQHYGFHVRKAFMVPYNSDPTTIASPIAKLTVATT